MAMLLKDVPINGKLIACFDLPQSPMRIRRAIEKIKQKYPVITLITFTDEEYQACWDYGCDVIRMAYSELLAFDNMDIAGIICGTDRDLSQFGKGVMRI